MKKVLMLASVASMIDQFNMANIKILEEMGCKVHVVANFKFGNTNPQERVNAFKEQLISRGIVVHDIAINRNAFSLRNIKVYEEIKTLINKEKFDLIHCHSPIGAVITRLAAEKARNNGTRVMYTAHGFHFFSGAPKKNWLIYYPVERLLAKYTDVLITINHEDFVRAKKSFAIKEVVYIHGVGLDIKKFGGAIVDQESKRKSIGVPSEASVLLSVGELIIRKNHEVVIKAIAQLNNKNIYYVICGQGELEQNLRELAKKLSVERQVIFLGFRQDIQEICKVSDIFVFPSLQEGLPVALMEAMEVGLTCLVSRIRGNVDLIDDESCMFNHHDVEELVKKIDKLLNDKKNRQILGKINSHNINRFSSEVVGKEMKKVYSDVLNM